MTRKAVQPVLPKTRNMSRQRTGTYLLAAERKVALRAHVLTQSVRIGLKSSRTADDTVRGYDYFTEEELYDECPQKASWAPRIEQGGDEGFTLIELLVVLLIIGILLNRDPTFLSVTKTANNTAAQSNLQTGFTGAKTYFEAANQTYQGLTTNSTSASDITQVDTGLSFVSTSTTVGSTASNIISVQSGNTGTYLILTAASKPTADCWGILDITATQGTAVWGYKAIGTYYGVWKGYTTTGSNTGLADLLPAERPALWDPLVSRPGNHLDRPSSDCLWDGMSIGR